MIAVEEGLPEFGKLLRTLRTAKSMSLGELAKRVNYTKGHLSRVETGGKRPSRALAASCDQVLNTGGTLARALPDDTRRPGLAGGQLRLAQLPVPTASFVGRQDDIALLDLLLADRPGHGSAPRSLLITGAPGVGKTALALHWASRVGHRFDDGVLYADLGGFSDEEAESATILEGFLLALGLTRDAIPAGLSERAGAYRNLLASRQVLVVLDNVASTGQVRPLMPGLVGESTLLMTSRRLLSGLAVREGVPALPLAGLRMGDAVEFLRSAVANHTVMMTPRLATRLAQLCECLPLALIAVVHHLRCAREADVPALVQRLENEHSRLDALAVFGDASLSVRDVFWRFYRALPRSLARAVRVLGLRAPGRVDAAVAAGLLGITPDAAGDLLLALADANVLIPLIHGGYRWSPLLCTFAAADLVNHVEPDSGHYFATDWETPSIAKAPSARAGTSAEEDGQPLRLDSWEGTAGSVFEQTRGRAHTVVARGAALTRQPWGPDDPWRVTAM
ncbi:helix-turn-helix domain-containing protein [Streptomyces sp. NPDC002588]|uniref:helix-turn-helix domain-containing protein n=1 Tax=Streptomyces sp. NPDC002588 TaxID=3154419 RepID=UPI00331F2734